LEKTRKGDLAGWNPPNALIVVDGKLVKNETVIAEAYELAMSSTKSWIIELEEKLAFHKGQLIGIKQLLQKERDKPPVDVEAPVLVSPNYEHFVWHLENEARCDLKVPRFNSKDHIAPVQNCTCGLYCYYDIPGGSGAFNSTLAIVSCWGRIEAHKTGMRTQFMKIEALLSQNPDVRKIADSWGIIYMAKPHPAQIKALAEEVGNPMPNEMRAT